MTIVGVISDTHGKLDPRAYAALADADHIIHAGDIGDPAILRELETLAPVTAVLGNNDYNEYGDQVGIYAKPVIDGVRFLVSHYPRDVFVNSLACKAIQPGEVLPQVCIHGHTHVPRILTGKEAGGADILLCPGSAFRPREGFPRCIARIELDEGRVKSVSVQGLDGRTIMEKRIR